MQNNYLYVKLNVMNMKKKMFLIIILSIILCGCDNKKTVINYYDNLTFEFGDKIFLNDLLFIENGHLENEGQEIDYNQLGNNTIDFTYISNKNRKKVSKVNINLVDTTPPLLSISNTITIKVSSDIDLCRKAFYGDIYDRMPKCEIIGDYDLNKIGSYKLSILIKDSSNNYSQKEFTLNVVDRINNQQYEDAPDYLNDVIKKYKNDNTMIGIDVSTYQTNIDWNLVKNSGIEFAIIRIGFGHDINNNIIEDKMFRSHIKGAKEAGLKVGVYFYSYATEIKEIEEQTNWIVNTLNGEKLDLPVAFDYETWSTFGKYEVSFYDMNKVYQKFSEIIKNNNYEPILYGSKYYLNNVWNLDSYPTWLAHYTSQTDYDKPYYIWQFTNTGIVPGITSYVDLDILYKK